jgi:protein TonB
MSLDQYMVESYPAWLLRWTAATLLVTGIHVGGGATALLLWNHAHVPEESAGSIAIELAPVAIAPPAEKTNLAHGPHLEEAAPSLPSPNQPAEQREKDQELPKVEPAPLAPEPEVALPIQKSTEETKPSQQSQQPSLQHQSPDQAVSAPVTTAPPDVAANAAPTPAAPTPGTSDIPASIRASWQKAVLSHLNRFKRYPDAARVRGIQGIVKIEFKIDREGRLLDSHVAQSSGSPTLDAEALATLRRADPLPAPPAKTAETAFYLVLPIHFRIR